MRLCCQDTAFKFLIPVVCAILVRWSHPCICWNFSFQNCRSSNPNKSVYMETRFTKPLAQAKNDMPSHLWKSRGDDSSRVQGRLKNVKDTQATHSACAALLGLIHAICTICPVGTQVCRTLSPLEMSKKIILRNKFRKPKRKKQNHDLANWDSKWSFLHVNSRGCLYFMLHRDG